MIGTRWDATLSTAVTTSEQGQIMKCDRVGRGPSNPSRVRKAPCAPGHAPHSPPEKAASTTCECGAQKNSTDRACSTCSWLDGATTSEQRVIAALRAIGGEGCRDALVLELDAQMPERTLRRTLAKLRGLGRVTAAVERDDDNRNVATYRLTSKASVP